MVRKSVNNVSAVAIEKSAIFTKRCEMDKQKQIEMDKQKQIEEINEIRAIMKLLDKCVSLNPLCNSEVATVIYGNNYRKIPENAVVLDKAEYEELKLGNDFNYGYHEGESNMTAYYENIRLPEVRKETAEKFAEMLKDELKSYRYVIVKVDHIDNKIDEICKEFTEGDNGR